MRRLALLFIAHACISLLRMRVSPSGFLCPLSGSRPLNCQHAPSGWKLSSGRTPVWRASYSNGRQIRLYRNPFPPTF